MLGQFATLKAIEVKTNSIGYSEPAIALTTPSPSLREEERTLHTLLGDHEQTLAVEGLLLFGSLTL